MDSAIKIQSTKRAQNEVKTDSIARLSDANTAVSAQKTAGAGAREKVEKAQRARAARSMHGLMQRAMLGVVATSVLSRKTGPSSGDDDRPNTSPRASEQRAATRRRRLRGGLEQPLLQASRRRRLGLGRVAIPRCGPAPTRRELRLYRSLQGVVPHAIILLPGDGHLLEVPSEPHRAAECAGVVRARGGPAER